MSDTSCLFREVVGFMSYIDPLPPKVIINQKFIGDEEVKRVKGIGGIIVTSEIIETYKVESQ